MKVLFAVHDEKVSSSIVKKYQKEYKEIISYKNVYYFNAILKELQRDKTYDRILIDEELEEFTSSSYEQKDKFIFDKLDNITDEATNIHGKDIPIILICTERRTKSENILVKLFGIGIYNAIIGNDRSTDTVCKLIKKPRSKKEAKLYYKIDVEDVIYKHENENDVSEEEMQNILGYFKRLGKDEARYIDGFTNLVKQYNEEQLKVIISMLPVHVKSILESSSPEYQKIVLKGGIPKVSNISTKKSAGTSAKLLTNNNSKGKPIVVPSQMDKTLIKKVTIKKPTTITATSDEEEPEEVEEQIDALENEEKEVIKEEEPKKRGRGRPKKTQPEITNIEDVPVAPRRRGRPRKNPLPQPEEKEKEEEENNVLPGIVDEENPQETTTLPGLEEEQQQEQEIKENENIEEESNMQQKTPQGSVDEEKSPQPTQPEMLPRRDHSSALKKVESQDDYIYDYTEYRNLLSSSKKVIAFVGTSKNGTSFIVNNIADILAKNKVDTAILDTTQNKNSYYIYTKNDENLRITASKSTKGLLDGELEGIPVSENLSVYTESPNEESVVYNAGPILSNLVKAYSAVLIDCDFSTPLDYFKEAQEIYLIQSMDVLTIQAFTEFLRELKLKNIINESKIKIIVNKSVKIKGVSAKTIVGGLANYNDPDMFFMTELFDRNSVVPIEVPFDMDAYQEYLEQIINCEISTDKYSKDFQETLKDLACIVYPLLPVKGSKEKQKKKKGYPYEAINNNQQNNGFSDSMNNTLNNMRKKY